MKRIHCPIASRNSSNGGMISLIAESHRVGSICKGLVKRPWGLKEIDRGRPAIAPGVAIAGITGSN